MRFVIALVAAFFILAPIGLAVSLWPSDAGNDSASGPQLVTEEAEVLADEPPLDLTAESSLSDQGTSDVVPNAARSLAELAEADPEGAQALVRDALLSDPSILSEALVALEAAELAAEQAEVVIALDEVRPILEDPDRGIVLGNPEGSITLVEFLDYNCGFCRQAHADVLALVDQNPDLRVIVRDFPVLGPGSLEAAQIAVAARQLGGEMETFLDVMMRMDTRVAGAEARTVAGDVGVSSGDLDALLADVRRVNETIAETYAIAERLEITGTPAFLIGDERIMGAVGFDRLQSAVQAQRSN